MMSTPNDPAAPTAPAPGASDRDFDVVPTADQDAADPAADAVEAAAQANARRARQRLLAEMGAGDQDAAAAGADQGPFTPTRGKERWPVKTVTDDDLAQVVATPQQTTVENLLLLERPADMPLSRAVAAYQSKRAANSETTVWQVEGTIIGYKWEQDGDYHIVLQSLNSGYTMIVEAPQDGVDANGDPFVDPASPFKAQIEAARRQLQQRLNPTPRFVNSSIRARVTGVGFFDILHGQTGVAETNAIELHPITDVTFL